jgi:predicted porin
MKKKLLAVAVVGALASPLAFAQNVTLYGGVDMGIQHADAGQDGAKTFVSSGQWYTSRIGVKGSDDLAGGLYGLFQLEAGIAADAGTQDGDGFWQRTAMAGLGNKAWGELTLGRQYTHMFNQANPLLGTTLAGTITPTGFASTNAKVGTNVGTPDPTRANNYIKYSSPSFGGLNFGAGYSTNAVAAEDTADADSGKYWDAHIGYAMKPFSVDFGHSNLKGGTAFGGDELKRNQLVGMWDSGAFGVFLGFAKDKNSDGDFDQRRIWVQPVARFGGNNEVYGLWAQMKDKNDGVGGGELKTTWLGVAYRHLMSKRTYVYANWGRSKNDGAGTIGALKSNPQSFSGPTEAADEDSSNALGVGVVVTF